jgi:NADH-quinone oxidoreductase subunit G
MPLVTVDGVEIEVPQGATVLQACELAGKEIPRFCYHERLSIAGNCRMCLVEVSPGPPKPQASCALPAADKQVIRTDTPMVKKAREGMMEFLLINHPLDCPICDQGGECDLQDQAMAYGRGTSRFDENKRAVEDKYMGPVIKTAMTRCIQCTRCIRFSEEVAGTPEIGMLYRGEDSQITAYLEKALTSELSGNLGDICPVGALLQRPQSFEIRPWELKKVPAIDVMDAVGSNIRLDVRQRQVMRILPRINEDVNEEWISDKARHHVDALVRGRLDRPWVRDAGLNGGGKLRAANWPEALALFAEKLSAAGSKVAAIAGDLVDAETMYAAKALLAGQGSTLLEGRQTGLDYDVTSLSAVAFNSSIAGIESADAILLVGTNIRWEAPLINTRLRKAARKGAKIFGIGPEVDLGYRVTWLGDDLSLVGNLPKVAADAFAAAVKPALILGPGGLAKGAMGAALAAAASLNLVRDGWNGFNVLHTAASRMAGILLGYAQAGGIADIVAAKPELVISLGADELGDRLAGIFTVYVGHHGDKGAAGADLVLPGAAYTEKHGTFVNTEGRVQRSERAAFAPGDAREDWTIFRAVSDLIGQPLLFDRFDQLRSAMHADTPALARDGLVDLPWSPPKLDAKASGPVGYPIADFYLTNAICRASPTMHRCSEELIHGEAFAEAAE